MITLKFIYLIFIGKIVLGDVNDGRQMYNIQCDDNKVIEYAYKPEVYQYLETGVFEYDEMLTLKNKENDNNN
jgi:hypothetical protein